MTGNRGFLGSNLAPFLESRGYEVTGFDLQSGDDVTDAISVIEVSKKCDAVIHLGAIARIDSCQENPETTINCNILGTRNVCYASQIHEIPLVFASTFAAKSPRNVYGLTKRLGEELVLKARGVVLRLANVYGGENYLLKSNAMSNFVRAKKNGEVADIYGGSQSRDFVEIRDVCKAFEMGLSANGGIYEVCTGDDTTILELAIKIGTEYELHPKKDSEEKTAFLPNWYPTITLEEGLKELMKCT